MILSYNEAIEKYGNEYKLLKAVYEGELFKQEEGIYSTEKYVSELGIIAKKYSRAIISGNYAFYYHCLTNLIPDKYDLATPSKAAKIQDNRIHQVYIKDDIFSLGIEEKLIDGVIVKIYDKERMLIELLRNKNKMPYDLYKEIIVEYRDLIYSLDISRIQEYASIFPKSKMISEALDKEVL